MNGPLILIIEDEAPLRRFLLPALQSRGYRVSQAKNAAEGLEAMRLEEPDLVLLDLGLPDRDGFWVLQEIRHWSKVPVVVLSARNQERDKVRALDQGADDYLTKPFSAAELMARIRVAQRHAAQQEAPPPLFETGGLKVDLAGRTVQLDGERVHLTPLQFRLLAALTRRAGGVATHVQLLTEVWGPQQADQIHYLRIYMAQLRQKLEKDPSRPAYLITEPGVGYRLGSG